ncbi:Uncharacterised protein [Yersinia enterocolitica]|nr:Uncharacterised protein [Yersinia enterocolitica]
MEKYSRSLQLEILNALMNAAPSPLPTEKESELISKFSDNNQFMANIIYLQDHKLIENSYISVSTLQSGTEYIFNSATCRLTYKGVDFLIGDDGLSALLNVQVVRLHADTLEALQAVVASSSLDPEMKSNMIKRLKELPADAIKHLTLQLLTQGVLNLPHAIQLIQKVL